MQLPGALVSMSHLTERELVGLNSLVMFQTTIILERLRKVVWKQTALADEDLAELIRGTRNFLDSLQDLDAAHRRIKNAQKE